MASPKEKEDIVIPSHILDDLLRRFIVNNEEMAHVDHVFELAVQAHWHYIDFYCRVMDPAPPKCSHKVFCKQIFLYLKEFRHLVPMLESLHAEWQAKRLLTPVFGGIILSPGFTHVLMVQGIGSRTTWGFPKSRQHPRESGKECAIREIGEETSLEVSGKIREDMSISCWIKNRFHKLYIIPNIRKKTAIHAKIRREFKEHKWIPVDSLPTHKYDPAPLHAGLDTCQFFNVVPFVKLLRKWIEVQKKGVTQPTIPAYQFTARGRRRGKDKDAQRRQGGLGPDGDASANKEGQGCNSWQSGVVRNLEEKFVDMDLNGPDTQTLILAWVKGLPLSSSEQYDDAQAEILEPEPADSTCRGQRQLDLDQFHF